RIITFASGICLRKNGGNEILLYRQYGSAVKKGIEHAQAALRDCSAQVVPAKPFPTITYFRALSFILSQLALGGWAGGPASEVGTRRMMMENSHQRILVNMEARLAQLLDSIISTSTAYALARL